MWFVKIRGENFKHVESFSSILFLFYLSSKTSIKRALFYLQTFAEIGSEFLPATKSLLFRPTVINAPYPVPKESSRNLIW
jgi:hypothetical protein